jgi:pyruvate/2-oxoglutarate dehydrogenase complex dihydrolipoamide acyltransferase (E2) component
MAKIIGLPKLSPTMEEGTLVAWMKQEGDAVDVDDLLAEVETDKATMEFRSFDKGVLLKILVPVGSTLAPDAPVAIIGQAGEDVSALIAKAGGGAAGAAPASKTESESKTVRVQDRDRVGDRDRVRVRVGDRDRDRDRDRGPGPGAGCSPVRSFGAWLASRAWICAAWRAAGLVGA